MHISEDVYSEKDCRFCSRKTYGFSAMLLRRKASQSSLRCSSVELEKALKFTLIAKILQKMMMDKNDLWPFQ